MIFVPLTRLNVSILSSVCLEIPLRLSLVSYSLTNFKGIVLASFNQFLKKRKDLFLQLALGSVFTYYLIVKVILLGLVIIYIYYWIQKHVLTDPELYKDKYKTRKSKAQSGFTESIKLIFSSGYIAKIACSVLCYGSIVSFLVSFSSPSNVTM